MLKKQTQAFQIRPLHTALPTDIEEHIPILNQDLVPNVAQNPDTYLSLLTYDPDGIITKLSNSKDIIERLKKVNAEFHEVFNRD